MRRHNLPSLSLNFSRIHGIPNCSNGAQGANWTRKPHSGAEERTRSQHQETQPKLTDGNAELLRRMVGGTGFEPVAPTIQGSALPLS